jgi:hypothetical protein
MDELHSPPSLSGLGLSCVTTRSQAHRAKQLCHQLAAEDHPAAHLAYWLGLPLRHHLPALR